MKLTETVMDEPARSPTPPPEADDQPPPAHPRRIEVELFDAPGALRAHDLRELTDLAERALALLPNSGSVRVRLVDDDEMAIAHARYAGIDATTDVLTFDLAPESPQAGFDDKALDTDLIICVDQARRQASEHQHTLLRELLLYIVHGTLHCLGYDDHDPKSYTIMHTKEDQMLHAIGVGATFFTRPAPDRGSGS